MVSATMAGRSLPSRSMVPSKTRCTLPSARFSADFSVWRRRTRAFTGTIAVAGQEQTVSGRGNGLISSVVTTIEEAFGLSLEVADYSEHALTTGRDSRAAAYLECRAADGRTIWGCGIDEDGATASVRAVLSAANSAIELA